MTFVFYKKAPHLLVSCMTFTYLYPFPKMHLHFPKPHMALHVTSIQCTSKSTFAEVRWHKTRRVDVRFGNSFGVPRVLYAVQ